MIEIWTPALAGIVAGLGVAMPLGAVGVLLLREGLENGFPIAAAAAAGVAVVDLVYCAFAAVVGTQVASTLEHHHGVFLLVSGLVIVGIGVRQLIATWRGSGAPASGTVDQTSAWRAFARFVVLTAINPITLVYFVALAGAVTTSNDSWVAPVVFVTAVGLSSLAWQLVVAGAGSLFGASISAGASRIVGVIASSFVVSLGAAVLTSGAVALA